MDLIVLLSVDVPNLGHDSTVLVARGDSDGQYPFALPGPGTDPHFFGAEATSLAIGEFVVDAEAPLLEVVAAVPSTGLVFLGFEARGLGSDRFVLIGGANVTSGLRPLLVRTTDLEGDGIDDILLASRDFDSVHLFRRLPSFDLPGQVGLHQTAQTALPPGTPRSMWVVDIDGDAIQDIIVHVEDRGSSSPNQVFAAVLDGVGGFVHSFQLPSGRVGDSGELRIDIGDMNRDGMPDLVLGSTGTTSGDIVWTLFGSRR